jgi:hypothetical protein
MECRAEKWGGTSEILVGLGEDWGGMVGNGVGDGIIGGESLANGVVLMGKALGGKGN